METAFRLFLRRVGDAERNGFAKTWGRGWGDEEDGLYFAVSICRDKRGIKEVMAPALVLVKIMRLVAIVLVGVWWGRRKGKGEEQRGNEGE